jgi:hypothetical protein
MRKLFTCSQGALFAPMRLAWADPVPSNRVIKWTYARVL